MGNGYNNWIFSLERKKRIGFLETYKIVSSIGRNLVCDIAQEVDVSYKITDLTQYKNY